MKIKREELRAICTAVKPALATREVIEQMTHFIFTGHEIVTYNDRMCIHHPLQTDFACSVSARHFYDILTKDDSDTIRLKLKDNYLEVTSPSLKSGTNTIVEADITELLAELQRQVKEEAEFKAVPDNFLEAIFFCMFSAATDVTWGALTCLLVSGNNIFSSDNLRVSHYQMSGEMDRFLLSAKAVPELIKFQNIQEYAVTTSWAHFKTEEKVLISIRLVDGEFIEEQALSVFEELERDGGVSFEMPEDILKGTSVAGIYADEGADFDKVVDVHLQKNKVICKTKKEQGWIEKTVKVSYDGTPVTFTINPVFMQQIMDKATKVNIFPNKAFFTRDNFRHVVALKEKS